MGTIKIDALNLTLDITDKDNITVIKPSSALFGQGRLLYADTDKNLDYCENHINQTSGEIVAFCGD